MRKLELGLYYQHCDYTWRVWRLLESVSVTTCINMVISCYYLGGTLHPLVKHFSALIRLLSVLISLMR